MSLRQIQSPWLTDIISTTDATPTISAACSYTVPSGAMGYVDINVIVKGAATIVTATTRVPFRNVSGVLTLLTAIPIVALAGDAGLLAAVLNVTTSGTTVQPRVTGIAVTNLEWILDCRYSVN